MDKVSRKSWSPIKENQLAARLARLERSPSGEEFRKYAASSSGVNKEDMLVDEPTGPKRRRMISEENQMATWSQVSSQMSSRSHSPSQCDTPLDDSLLSTPSASPSSTLKEHFRRQYRKHDLWNAIETNYTYLMDKGIIEACQESQDREITPTAEPVASFGDFLKQYKEITDWLKNIQTVLQKKASKSLALSEKYLNRSYYEELDCSPKLKLLNDYAVQLKTCQPVLTEEVDVFLKEVNAQWATIQAAVKPSNLNLDPVAMVKDLSLDLETLTRWLDGIEDHLRMQMSQAWQYEELEAVLSEHKVQQTDIEAHSRVISAVLKLSDHLHDNGVEHGVLETSSRNLERRWHGIWLQSLEWQCRLEDAISRRKGICNPTPYIDTYSSLRDFDDDDDDYDYDSHDVTSGGEDSFPELGYRGDFVQSPQKTDCSTSFSPEFDRRSGKDSAVASESEQKTSSDMSENYQDLSVSTCSESEREFQRQFVVKKHDSRDIGYGSESLSDDHDGRMKGITFTGIRGKKNSSNDYYATVAVDTESTDKTDGWNSANQDQKSDDSDINGQVQTVLKQEEPQMEDIRYLINQADLMIQQGNTFNKSFSPKHQESLASLAPPREMVDKGVGTVESSCDASDEESGESDGQLEDTTETIDSVLASEYTSDEMRNGMRDNMRLPKLYDTSSLKIRVKGRGRERPWSVIECVSPSEPLIERLSMAYSDSEISETRTRPTSHSLSPTLSRHRIRKIQRPISGKTSSSRSQLGAKRKLNLELHNISPVLHNSITVCSKQNAENTPEVPVAQIDSVHFRSVYSSTPVHQEPISENLSTPVKAHKGFSGPGDQVPLMETSEEELMTPQGHNNLISTLQNARFKSSGSSYDDSDTNDPTAVSELEDPNDGNFSENAWDNYQAPLYTTGSEDPPEEALPWEPVDMEFDDEFGLPTSTILATLLARKSEDEGTAGKHAKLIPSSHANMDDSDSDIEDLHHVLQESHMQLKVAMKSLRKKRKDPLKTGLYENPGKYGQLLATIETNIRCLQDISQQLDQADFTEEDKLQIQDLLYQWDRLRTTTQERQLQSQEVKTMYAVYLTVEGIMLEGIPQLDKRGFNSVEEVLHTAAEIMEKQKLLLCQKQILSNLNVAVRTFSTQNATVDTAYFMEQIKGTQLKIDDLLQRCLGGLRELEHIHLAWFECSEIQQHLKFLLAQERDLIDSSPFSQCVDEYWNQVGGRDCLKKLMNSLSLYEENLRADWMDMSDEGWKIDLDAGLADIRKQLSVARNLIGILEEFKTTYELKSDSGVDVAKTVPAYLDRNMELARTVPAQAAQSRPQVWTKSFPLTAVAFAVFLGLLYLFAPSALHKLLDFSIRITPELEYTNGAPPV
ncbi:uncharacterized protein LOC127872805 isoform X2 [Dreissena polymorpha]|uniref:uncharacterized protein LOC127872805 isoform X2 n=1 Tax=Dreissena polymorpha TaxID=45954 RepID=UPI0022651493|nr:uncharacterized protein LOC127872805 isoform X2 [Dreissena polymorpha]